MRAYAEAGVDLSDPIAIRAFVASLPYAVRGTTGGDTSCVEVRSAGNFDYCNMLKANFGDGKAIDVLEHVPQTHPEYGLGM